MPPEHTEESEIHAEKARSREKKHRIRHLIRWLRSLHPMVRKTLRYSLGTVSLILAIIFTFLPVMPQAALYVIALLCFGFRLEWMLRQLDRLPRFGKRMADGLRRNAWVKEILDGEAEEDSS